MSRLPMLSICVPVLNERALLERAVPKILEAASALPVPFELIIASDGPGCAALGEMFVMSDSRIVHCHSGFRRGKGGAISDAAAAAHGDLFCFFDVDLATDLKHLPEMVSALSAYDIVIGSRRMAHSDVSRGVVRGVVSRGYISYVKRMLGLPFSDLQCGFKGFRTDVLRTLVSQCREHGLVWDTEILAHANRGGFRIFEMPVVWHAGETSSVKPSDVFRMGAAVRRIRRRLRCGCSQTDCS